MTFSVSPGPAYDPSNTHHVLLGAVLGFDGEGGGLWNDFDGERPGYFEDIHGFYLDMEYIVFLEREGLPYYGMGGAPHDPTPHHAAFTSFCEAFYYGPRD